MTTTATLIRLCAGESKRYHRFNTICVPTRSISSVGSNIRPASEGHGKRLASRLSFNSIIKVPTEPVFRSSIKSATVPRTSPRESTTERPMSSRPKVAVIMGASAQVELESSHYLRANGA